MIKAFVGRLKDLGARGTTAVNNAGNTALNEIEDLAALQHRRCGVEPEHQE